jgi:protein-L-isoaspartate O-methyltransferase
MDRADLERPDARAIVGELDELVRWLEGQGLQASSWYGGLGGAHHPRWESANRGYGYIPLPGTADDSRYPWFLYWEIAWLVINNDFRPGQSLLDLGGSSSLFSFLMASRGLLVTTVDLDGKLVANANRVAAATGWQLENRRMDMRELVLETTFDHVTSVCVFEHVPVSARASVSSRIGGLLRDGGSLSITFDYGNPSRLARISSQRDVEEQLVVPSGLRIRGNADFHDNGKRYLLSPFFHPDAWRRGWKLSRVVRGQFGVLDLPKVKRHNDYTFGALFLTKS